MKPGPSSSVEAAVGEFEDAAELLDGGAAKLGEIMLAAV